MRYRSPVRAWRLAAAAGLASAAAVRAASQRRASCFKIIPSSSSRTVCFSCSVNPVELISSVSGNLIRELNTTYTYRDFGQRGQMWRSATDKPNYDYNGLGQRISKRSPLLAGGANVYAYDEAGHLLGEYDAAGVALEGPDRRRPRTKYYKGKVRRAAGGAAIAL